MVSKMGDCPRTQPESEAVSLNTKGDETDFGKFRRIDDIWVPKVLIGDIRKVAKSLPDNFADCVITSPPYWMQRDYNHQDQIGREKKPEKYVEEITTVFEKLRPKLKKTATVFLNVGYKYVNGELLLIPEMIALQMSKRGFTLKNKIIWWKPNAMPTPARDRFNYVYEPVLFFIRDDGKEVHYFNIEAVSEKTKTLEYYTRLLSFEPKELIGLKVVDSLLEREGRKGKVIGVRYVVNNPTEVCVEWNGDGKEWIPFGDPSKSYPEEISFACPLCKGTINYWSMIMSFANLEELVCPECQKTLGKSAETFPVPEFGDIVIVRGEVKEVVDAGAKLKKYLTKIPKSSKFLKAGMNQISMASPAGRLAIQGEYLTVKRRWNVPQLLIAEYLRFWREEEGMPIEDIDKTLGYAYTAGHWFRRDFGHWGKGGSIPKTKDWSRLKEILNFNDICDRVVTEKVAVLQTVKPHEKGRNPGDVWKIALEKYSEAHFSVFPTKLVETAMRSGCPPTGIVLDPFAGSGTVGEVAMKLGRKAVLVELAPDFLELIKKRCRGNVEVVHLKDATGNAA
jgi:DNA modification methylase